MFTGIIEEQGRIRALRRGGPGALLDIACALVLDGTRVGDSISVNGCCLTVTEVAEDGFKTEMMGETLERTVLGSLAEGASVNLERALAADARLGGHLVQGHVDGIGTVHELADRGQWTVMRISVPEHLERYVVEKGSITVDGASLTVMAVEAGAFSVGLIPHTLAVTTLGQRAVGDPVNLEVDLVAKYVERMLAGGAATPYGAADQEESR